MQITTTISFEGMPESEAARHEVQCQVRQLQRCFRSIATCRVVVGRPHQPHRNNSPYLVRLDLSMPNGDLAADQELRVDHSDGCVRAAVRRAFETAQRRLHDNARRTLEPLPRGSRSLVGRVTVVFLQDECGLLRTSDGRTVFFDRGALIDEEFDGLDVGDRLLFEERTHEGGARASRVRLAHRPRGTLTRQKGRV